MKIIEDRPKIPELALSMRGFGLGLGLGLGGGGIPGQGERPPLPPIEEFGSAIGGWGVLGAAVLGDTEVI